MKAFYYNGNIYITTSENIPQDATCVIEVDNVNVDDLIYVDNILRYKTEEERKQDSIEREKKEAKEELSKTDMQMARVVEDVINILITKNIIKQDDLPTEVIEKINYRKELRSKINENIK